MEGHRSPHPGPHIGGERRQIAVFLIKSIGKTGVDVVVQLICLPPQLIQLKDRRDELHTDVIVPVQHDADTLISGNDQPHSILLPQDAVL